MGFKFCPIASGSDGNCIFISYGETRILIDAGLSGKQIENGLKQIDEDCSNIDALFITHEHSDHIHGAGIISRRYDIPIFASQGTWEIMNERNMLGKISGKNKRYVYDEEKFLLNDLCILPFSTPHDCCDPINYAVYAGDKKLVVATDIGHVTEGLSKNLMDSDLILIESNHDLEMLKNSPYPYTLKKRISGEFGHLSNIDAGRLIVDAFSNKLKHVILGHLSGENNTPILAHETVHNILEVNNIPVNIAFKLHTATRGRVGKLINL